MNAADVPSLFAERTELTGEARRAFNDFARVGVAVLVYQRASRAAQEQEAGIEPADVLR